MIECVDKAFNFLDIYCNGSFLELIGVGRRSSDMTALLKEIQTVRTSCCSAILLYYLKVCVCVCVSRTRHSDCMQRVQDYVQEFEGHQRGAIACFDMSPLSHGLVFFCLAWRFSVAHGACQRCRRKDANGTDKGHLLHTELYVYLLEVSFFLVAYFV